MSIALWALIIALFSLIWNVVTAAHSWRADMPSIKLDLRKASWYQMEVNLRNRGGSPVAVSRIELIVFYKTRHDQKIGWRHRTWTIATPNDLLSPVDISGPGLPFTILGYHNQEWKIPKDIRNVFWENRASRGVRIINISIRIDLATGKQIRKKLPRRMIGRFTKPQDSAVLPLI